MEALDEERRVKGADILENAVWSFRNVIGLKNVVLRLRNVVWGF